MQRVLSFQMARGLNESSELVTKRMCFSFLFSVGFLCLLCGFLLGRFSTQRAFEFRAEKKRLELAGNGLDTNEYLQRLILEQLKSEPVDDDFEVYVHFSFMHSSLSLSVFFFHLNRTWKSFTSMGDHVRRANGTLSNFSLIHKVVNYPSCIVATVQGSREPGD